MESGRKNACWKMTERMLGCWVFRGCQVFASVFFQNLALVLFMPGSLPMSLLVGISNPCLACLFTWVNAYAWL